MNPAGRRLFDEFLTSESPECRRLWHGVTRLADVLDVDFADLGTALESADRPTYHRAVALLDRLAALGSLRRLQDLISLAEAIDEVDAPPQVQTLIVYSDRNLN